MNPTELRHALHRAAELSDEERQTAALLKDYLRATEPSQIVEGLGGEGFAVVYEGVVPGPRVLLRADLDALPIDETVVLGHGSERPGVSHKCGHDGHMTMVAGVGKRLGAEPLERGTAILLFQPAEETGQGAARVIADERFGQLAPDWVYAVHNLPGFPLGAVVVRPGPFAAASSGLVVELRGNTSHAAEPHQGRSPAMAIASLIQSLSAAPQCFTGLHDAALATIIHARVGQVAFGTSPGEGVVMATLRAALPIVMAQLSERSEALCRGIAQAHGLEVSTRWVEEFPATVNDPVAVAHVVATAERLGMLVVDPPVPFSWSEDFGHFTAAQSGALIGLGAGEQQPALHHPHYDFPDGLLGPGTAFLVDLLRSVGKTR